MFNILNRTSEKLPWWRKVVSTEEAKAIGKVILAFVVIALIIFLWSRARLLNWFAKEPQPATPTTEAQDHEAQDQHRPEVLNAIAEVTDEENNEVGQVSAQSSIINWSRVSLITPPRAAVPLRRSARIAARYSQRRASLD